MCTAAIGVGGEGFAASMRSAVEGVVGQVREDSVSLRPSSAGKYISVTVGPVLVESGDQVRPSAACCFIFQRGVHMKRAEPERLQAGVHADSALL